jgi:plastocyanin
MTGRFATVTVVASALLALSGCGGGGDSEDLVVQNVRVARVIDVHETEFALSPTTIRIERFGFYGIKAINDGAVGHALELEGHGIEKTTGIVAPGESKTLLVRFKVAGTYTLYCPVDGHEQKGMKATLKVH